MKLDFNNAAEVEAFTAEVDEQAKRLDALSARCAALLAAVKAEGIAFQKTLDRIREKHAASDLAHKSAKAIDGKAIAKRGSR
jgi:hypothetical protein